MSYITVKASFFLALGQAPKKKTGVTLSLSNPAHMQTGISLNLKAVQL